MNDQFAQRSRDLDVIDCIAAAVKPQAYEKTVLAALLMRYSHDEGMLQPILAVLREWQISPGDLFREARAIWAHGYRPSDLEVAGSAWDAGEKEEEA